MRQRELALARLDAFLNRTREHKLHMLDSVLWLRKAKAAPAVRRPVPEKSLEQRDHPPSHP
jgi:hypothetical protein